MRAPSEQHVKRPARRRGALAVAAILFIGALASCDYNPGDPARYEPRANVAWPDRCAPFNVAILIDRSSSVGDTGSYTTNYNQVQSVKQAVNGVNFYGSWIPGLLDILAPTNARVWIGSFATLAKQHYPADPNDESYYALNNPTNLANAKNAVAWMQFAGWQTDWAGTTWYTNYNDYPDDPYDGANGRGNTNWQGAIDAPPGVPHLTIVLTDGDPTMYNNFMTPNADVQESTVNAAVNQANSSKYLSGRVIAFHFGQKSASGPFGGWEQRLQRISGPVSGVDYFNTTFTGLQSSLTNAWDPRCLPATTTTLTSSSSSITVGQSVTLTYRVTNTGNVNMNAGTLTDTGGNRPGWSTPVTASSPGQFTTSTYTFTPSAAGTYTFKGRGCGAHTGTGAAVCSESAPVTINVANPPPAAVVPT